MHEVLNWVWQGCAIALATAITLQFLKRSRARDRYAFCWAALIFVLLLPILPGVSIAPAAPSSDPGASSGRLLTMPHTWWTSTRIAIILWMLWVAAQTIRLATGLVALQRVKRSCRSFPASVEAQLTHWTQVKEQGRRARLVVAGGVRSAAVLGCGSPVIAVAPAIVERLEVDELDRIIVHEWAHVQRRDDRLNAIQVLIRVVAGWHPAVRWLNRQLAIEREMACDEMAVAVTGSLKRYAASLATLAGLSPQRSRVSSTLGALSSPALSRRILRILSQKHLVSPLSSARTAIAAASFICVLSLAIAEYEIVGRPVLMPFVVTIEAAAPQSQTETASPSSTAKTPAAVMTIQRPAETRMETETRLPMLPKQETSAADSTQVAALEPLRREHSALPPDHHPLDIRLMVPPRVVAVGPPPGTDAKAVTPWGAAADAGVALGRGSRNAGVASAGAFSRLGKKIASSF